MRCAIRRTPAGISLHLREDDVLGVEGKADLAKVSEGAGLIQLGGIADDAEARDTIRRRQPRNGGVGHASRDAIEIVQAGLVVERHDRDTDPPIYSGAAATTLTANTPTSAARTAAAAIGTHDLCRRRGSRRWAVRA